MGKRFHAIIILTLACLLCGCADRQGQENPSDEGSIPTESLQDTGTRGMTPSTEASKETASNTEAAQGTAQNTERETKEAQAAEASEDLGAENVIWFIGTDANADFDFGVDEYDYVFYFRGLYLSCDGEAAQIYIDPVEFVWNWETERWLAWGNSIDEGPVYDCRNEKEEVISLPLTESTEFHMCNFHHDPILSEICDRNQAGWENVTTNPDVFMYYVRTQYSSSMGRYPFFMVLNEDGTVKYVIEYPLM